MGAIRDIPVTPGVRALRAAGVKFVGHVYPYVEHGWTRQAAITLDVDEHAVIKTLVMEAYPAQGPGPAARPAQLIVLMHGDREVSTKNLARHLGVKGVAPCDPVVADRHSGYQVGGTSPFGTRRAMPVYLQRTVAELPYVYVNGGRRGYLVGMKAEDLVRVLKPTLVDITA